MDTLHYTDPEVLAAAYLDVSDEKASSTLLVNSLMAAERFIANRTSQQWWPEPALAGDGTDTLPPVTKTYRTRRRSIRVRSLRTLTGLIVDGLALVEGVGFWLPAGDTSVPVGRIQLAQPPYSWMPGTVTVTGRWGWLDVPGEVLDGTYRLGARLYRERDASWSDSRVTPDGSVLQYFKALPASVQMGIDYYRTIRLALA